MSRTFLTLLVGVFLLILAGCLPPALSKAKISVWVLDENGNPVADAEVRAGFSLRYQINETAQFASVSKRTDSKGQAIIENKTSGSVGWTIQKAGFYPSRYNVSFVPQSIVGFESWKHTNVAILKRVIKPVKLLGAGGNLGLPAFNQPCGFDLELNDWVAPHGKGKTADLIFEGQLDQRARDDFDYRLTVRFSNPMDGLIPFELPLSVGSRLRSAHQAPEDGYLPEWVQTRSQRPGQPQQNSQSETRNYYIRVRTKLDEQGRLQSAHYGKIYGDFLQFSSYLNPTPNDRNLEYAPPEDDGISPL
jgi:hypothetical protein